MGGAIGIEELRTEPVVLREPGSGTRKAFEEAIKHTHGASLESLDIAAELGSMTAVKEAVLGGLGVSVISTRAIRREVEAGILTTYRIDGVDLSRSINLVSHRKRSLSPAGVRFVKYLVSATRGTSEIPNPAP